MKNGERLITNSIADDGGGARLRRRRKIKHWVARVHHATGRTPIIYSGEFFWNDNVGSSALAHNPLWLPQYGPRCPTPPNAWHRWTFFQYSDHGHVAGISGPVDHDKFNGALDRVVALANG